MRYTIEVEIKNSHTEYAIESVCHVVEALPWVKSAEVQT